ncbi:MAG: hypothetical protein ACI9ES_001688 [Oceanospirillaceae bacterium]|jgi:hypothetical protein
MQFIRMKLILQTITINICVIINIDQLNVILVFWVGLLKTRGKAGIGLAR